MGETMGKNPTETVAPTTEDDIREIIEQAEAGVADLVSMYERIEQRYFAGVSAATAQQRSVHYATHT